jgi:heme-degrading monooxygenase HmoA
MNDDFIVVVTFETDQQNHAEAKELIGAYIKDFLSQQPGFIESKLHENRKATGLLHYARWKREADFRAFAEIASAHPALSALRKFKPNANFYDVWATY